jgi:ketosteroid isomerase-like protein
MDHPRESTEAKIRALFEDGAAAWNRGDLDGYLAGYWDSEKTRWARGGMVIRGKEAISGALSVRFPTPDTMGTIEAASLEIEVLSDTDALVFGRLVHTLRGTIQKGLFTVHVRNIGGNWLVVSDHFSFDA